MLEFNPCITIKSILIHEYQHKSTRVNTSPTRVNTNQHESKTGLDKILLKIKHN